MMKSIAYGGSTEWIFVLALGEFLNYVHESCPRLPRREGSVQYAFWPTRGRPTIISAPKPPARHVARNSVRNSVSFFKRKSS